MSTNAIKWIDIWKLFDADEQHDACLCLLEYFKENWDSSKTRRVLKRVAEGTGSRLPSIEAMVKGNADKLANIIRNRAPAILDEETWKAMFTSYYPRRKVGLLCAFLDEVGIEHDESGAPSDEDFAKPSSDSVEGAVARLLRSYTVKELARYLAVLAKHAEGWEFVEQERDRLLLRLQEEQGNRPEQTQADLTASASMSFTVLDRVLIEQVVRAAMQIEGSLPASDVEELIETTLRLSDKWYRAHFHLGFMDVLLPGREMRFDRPGDNEQRRGWYIAGVVAGLVRSHDTAGLENLLNTRSADLDAVLRSAGGPGASIARTALKPLLEIGRIAEAVKVIRGQIEDLGLDFAYEALEAATIFIRQSNFDSAKAIVDELSGHTLEEEDPEDFRAYQLELARRRAQCLQAAGNFDGAEKEYREILKAGEDLSSPDLLADLGLVKGRFRSLGEVRLPEGREARIALRESLAKGEDHFKRAVERSGPGSPKAAYPLAVLAYLRWMFGTEKEKEGRREQAAESASTAVNAILTSEFSDVYRQLGALGQSYFMVAVARMSSLDDVQGREAMVAWQSITEEAGKLPLLDIETLLRAAEPYGESIADAIAESVWDHRREEAVQILLAGPWMSRSPRLRAAMLSIAKNDQASRSERIRLWIALIPRLIKANDHLSAEEGLSELERLAERQPDCAAVLDFFSNPENYDPVWKETEASWTRIHLLRQLGRDVECEEEVRRLFYIVRDQQPWEAEQLLQAAEEWNLDESLRRQLQQALPRLESEEAPSIEARLVTGESVRIVFVGGNEVQARYDASVKDELHSRWPGIDIHFEHTAWSSNWGRDLDRLTLLANDADAVVLMYLMRTMLGRRLRAALKKPWIPCTATGKGAILSSLRRAAIVGLQKRETSAQSTAKRT